MLDLTSLEQLARAATPGEWKQGGCSGRMIRFRPFGNHGCDIADVDTMANSSFITAANPSTILKLLSVLKIQREALEYYADSSKWDLSRMREPMKSLGWTPAELAKQALARGREILEGKQE